MGEEQRNEINKSVTHLPRMLSPPSRHSANLHKASINKETHGDVEDTTTLGLKDTILQQNNSTRINNIDNTSKNNKSDNDIKDTVSIKKALEGMATATDSTILRTPGRSNTREEQEHQHELQRKETYSWALIP